MIATVRSVSEEDLHAYVDGHLAPDACVRVESYLRQHPEASVRVEEWRRGREALRQALNHKLREPIPSSLTLAGLAQARSRRHWSPQKMPASIIFAICGGYATPSSFILQELAFGQSINMITALSNVLPSCFECSTSIQLLCGRRLNR